MPKRWLRSANYWRLVELERRYGPMRKLERLRGRPAQEDIVQDIEVTIARASEFFDFLVREIPISPFWVCPLRPRDRRRWALYPLDPDATYVNFGFWSTLPLAYGQPDGTHNRRVEQVVEELGGRKSLYSDSYYDRDEFWRLHDGRAYGRLKRAYDAVGCPGDHLIARLEAEHWAFDAWAGSLPNLRAPASHTRPVAA